MDALPQEQRTGGMPNMAAVGPTVRMLVLRVRSRTIALRVRYKYVEMPVSRNTITKAHHLGSRGIILASKPHTP